MFSPSAKPVISYDSHIKNVTVVGLQCDGKWMYSGLEDGTVKIWDLKAPGFQREYESRAVVNNIIDIRGSKWKYSCVGSQCKFLQL